MTHTCCPAAALHFRELSTSPLLVFVQLAKDCEALKAQATSLLGELQERQSCLEKSEHERKMLEEK